jgi:hypothetical protein
VKVTVKVEGLDETLRAFNKYGKDANRELRQAAGAHVDRIVDMLHTAAANSGKGAALSSGSVRRKSDRVPALVAGGSVRVRPSRSSTRSFKTRPKKLSNKVTAGDVFFGYEFGGGARPTTQQFPPWLGKTGYWFWPLIRREMPALRRAYMKTLDELADKWAAGGNLPD